MGEHVNWYHCKNQCTTSTTIDQQINHLKCNMELCSDDKCEHVVQAVDTSSQLLEVAESRPLGAVHLRFPTHHWSTVENPQVIRPLLWYPQVMPLLKTLVMPPPWYWDFNGYHCKAAGRKQQLWVPCHWLSWRWAPHVQVLSLPGWAWRILMVNAVWCLMIDNDYNGVKWIIHWWWWQICGC